ncbi:ferritin-like domain-containing protein [Mycena leptocephala]|nr:ferritin-like domain-containing protein [Mycena leptocephala]
MRYSLTLLALVAPFLVSARPIRSRQNAPSHPASATDALVFQFAQVLNQLENEFYKQAIAKFQDADFTAAGFTSSAMVSQVLTAIQNDEATHIAAIQKTLSDNGATPKTCNFKFDSALTDVATTAATARVVELVGVGAFLGGATLIDDPVLLDAAGSILTTEARHQTLLNVLSGEGSGIPSAFDIALTPQEVVSIAAPFIDGPCDLGVTPTNTLTVTNSGPIKVGDMITVSATNISGTDNLFCNMILGGMPFAYNVPLSQCTVPAGVNGPIALWITSDDNPLINNVVNRDTTKQVAGPAIFFVDTQPEALGALVRGGSSSGSGSNNSGSNTGSAPAPASTPLPPNFTGPSPDGKVTVNGLTQVPRPDSDPIVTPSASASGSSPSSTDSASSSDGASSSDSASSTDSASDSSPTDDGSISFGN